MKYIYDEKTDLHYKVEVKKETINNKLEIDYLSFDTIDQGLTIMNNLDFLYNELKDDHYIQIKNKVINKLKTL